MNKKITIIVITIIVLLGVGYYLFIPKQPIALGIQNTQNIDRHFVEIFHLPHAPADAVVKKVEEILKKYPEYTVEKYNFDDEKNKTKVVEYGLEKHIPVAIFIGGINTFTIDGIQVSFQNFPKGDSFISGFEGPWRYDDLEKVLSDNR
jgi:hypothetical protein